MKEQALAAFSATMRRSTTAVAICASVLVAGGLAATTANAAKYKMAIAHLLPEEMNNEVHPALTHFKSIVEAGTNGEVEVQLFGGGQLRSEVETGKQAQGGKLLQSTVISSGAMSSFYPNYQLITAPFLFPNYQVAHTFFDSKWFAEFMKGSIKSSGLRYLGTFDDGGGFVAFTTSKKLIKTADDIKGMKIRVEENPAHIATMRALGASATPLPWGEVVTALSTGLADGQFNAPGVSKFYKLWEVNNYTTLSRHVYNSQAWLVSDSWFKSLPAEYQKVITQAARESISLAHGISALQAIDGWNKSCKRFKECYILPAAERQKMAAIAQPAWKSWIVNDFKMDQSLVDSLFAEVKKISDEADKANAVYAD